MLVYLIVNFLIAAVARGQASVVIPIENLSFVSALLISVLLGMERLTARKLIAVGCAIASIGLLSPRSICHQVQQNVSPSAAAGAGMSCKEKCLAST